MNFKNKIILINKDIAINVLREEFKKMPTIAIRAMETIKKLPPAQPEWKWTPCSDPSDLPKDERLWITREIYGARIVYDMVWDMTEWSDDISDVVAYMPYWEPEPYKERRKEDETD